MNKPPEGCHEVKGETKGITMQQSNQTTSFKQNATSPAESTTLSIFSVPRANMDGVDARDR